MFGLIILTMIRVWKRTICQDRLRTNERNAQTAGRFAQAASSRSMLYSSTTAPGVETYVFSGSGEERLFPTRPVLTMKHDCFVYQTDASICQEDSKKDSFLNFSYVCPERVLVKRSFLNINGSKRRRFSFHAGYPTPQVRKQSCCEPFYTKNDHFTKPGSGQTLEKHSKKRCACFLADI